LSSANFVCLLSRGAIKNPNNENQNWEKLSEASRCDNVLLEWRLALEFKKRGLLEGVFPIMIGDKDARGMYNSYSRSGCNPTPPDVVVAAVEAKTIEHLEREGLGLPYNQSCSVKYILETMLLNQGGKIFGDLQSSLDSIADAMVKMTGTQILPSIAVSTQPNKEVEILRKHFNDLKMKSDQQELQISSLMSLVASLQLQSNVPQSPT